MMVLRRVGDDRARAGPGFLSTRLAGGTLRLMERPFNTGRAGGIRRAQTYHGPGNPSKAAPPA